jgi:hypothetical protein
LDVLAGPWAAVEEGPEHRACYPGARWFDLFQINRRRSRSFEAGNSVVPLGKAASGRAPRLRSRRKNDVAGRAVHCPPPRNLFFYACCRGAAKDAIQRKREANAGGSAQTPCRRGRASERSSLPEKARAVAGPRSPGIGASRSIGDFIKARALIRQRATSRSLKKSS